MSKKKFTKGKWETNNAYVWSDGIKICEISEIDTNNKDIEAMANAKLISAAPDLLEACLAAFFKLTSSGELNCKYTAKVLEEAIDKAFGSDSL